MSHEIMKLLRESTQPLHMSVEDHPFQHALAGGKLSIQGYTSYLSQLYLVHRHLETKIRDNKPRFTALSVVAEHQYQEQFLLEDLKRLGVDVKTIEPVQATVNLAKEIDRVASDNPMGLLGFHYVLFGSKHGGKLIAKQYQGRHQPNDHVGISYFDPYGARFTEHWKTFVSEMNAIPLNQRDQQAIVQAAHAMFTGFKGICDALSGCVKS